MINYTTNQRRSLRYTASGNWQEEVLSASGVEVDQSNFQAIAGADIQAVLESIDNVVDGLTATPASGVVMIDDVVNVSGTVAGSLQNFDVITLGSGSNSVFRFSFGVPAQPVDPVHLRLLIAPRGASASGTVSGTLEYNLFDQNDDLTNGAYTYTGAVSQSLVAGDFEKLKILNITIPLTNFSSGTAPFIVDCKFTRDVSIGGNYGHDVSVIQIYADNIPGGATGNQAGYVGGNLEVTGDLTVDGFLILHGGSAPASGTAPGVSGSVVLSDDFLYAAVTTNSWKRIPINSF